MALKYAEIATEHREISLREKPKSMLLVSPKGTVPVLCIGDRVIDQSLDILRWALDQSDPDGWNQVDQTKAQDWVEVNDGPFKQLLDQYKYPNRYPDLKQGDVLQQAFELMLKPMEEALQKHHHLMGDKRSWVDIAIFPFIRQFAMVNPEQFATLPIPRTHQWLHQHLESALFQSIMEKHPTWTD